MSAVTRYCVFCGNLRDRQDTAATWLVRNGVRIATRRTTPATADRCGEDAHTTEARFDGTTGERLGAPPMPARNLLASDFGSVIERIV